jgi:hypothetical protein
MDLFPKLLNLNRIPISSGNFISDGGVSKNTNDAGCCTAPNNQTTNVFTVPVGHQSLSRLNAYYVSMKMRSSKSDRFEHDGCMLNGGISSCALGPASNYI